MKLPQIVVIGSVNADHVVRVPRIPGPGATLLADSLTLVPGGKGANQAVAGARLGARVALIGCVGDDDAGRRQLEFLRADGVDTTGVRTVRDTPTGLAFVVVAEHGENCIVVAPGANAELTPDDVERCAALFDDARVALVQCEIPVSVLAAVAQLCERRGIRLVVNCAPATRLPQQVLHLADPLVVNQSEAGDLLARPEPVTVGDAAAAAARDLLARTGCRSVVVTLGADGAVAVVAGASPTSVPGRVVDVVDTTGAGDAFVAALATALLRGLEIPEAVAVGVDAGANAVTRPGARGAFPSTADPNWQHAAGHDLPSAQPT